MSVAGCGGGYDSPSAEAESAPAAEATTTPAAMQTAEAVQEESTATKQAPATLSSKQLLGQEEPGAKPQVRDMSKVRSSDLQAQTPNPSTPGPSTLTLEPARLDLGTVSTNKNATGTVRLVNNGTDPITIQECKSSCGCTSTNCPKGKELQPGESADVDIRITGGTRARKISKTVTFRVVDQQPVILPVSVQVIAYVTIEPTTIDPETVTDGKVVIKATDGQPFRITNMSPPVITEFPEEAGVEHEIFLDWDVWRELGQGRRLVFNVDHPEATQVSTIVRATPVRRAQPDNPIQRTKQRLQDDGVVDAPLEEPDPPAKAAIAVKFGQVDEIKKQLATGLNEAQRNELLNLAARHGQVEVMGALVEAGASPTATDKRGRTPLMAAVQSRKAEAIQYLIDNGAEVNARDQLQGTALLRAAGTFGNLESVHVLLSAGAEVNVQDKNGMTPLMWAARWGDAQRVEALVKAGAKVAVRDKNGKSALDWARARGGKAEQTVEFLQPLTESEAKSSETGEPQVD
jgi:ankyrin repeat protein